MINDVEHLCMFLLSICITSLEKYILDTNLLSDIRFANAFSCGLSIEVHTFLILVKRDLLFFLKTMHMRAWGFQTLQPELLVGQRHCASVRSAPAWERPPGACSGAGSPRVTSQGSLPRRLSPEDSEGSGAPGDSGHWCLQRKGERLDALALHGEVTRAHLVLLISAFSSSPSLRALMNSWLARARMWAVVFRQDSGAVSTEWEVGEPMFILLG